MKNRVIPKVDEKYLVSFDECNIRIGVKSLFLGALIYFMIIVVLIITDCLFN
jgi:hypothetical protein